MGIKVVSPPSVEPVTLAEAKAHLRVDSADEDALITRLIVAAREQCEQELDRSLAQQTLQLMLDAFPAGALLLPRGPVISVSSVQYVDTAGVLQTVSANDYTLDDAQIDAWLLYAYGSDWPQARDQANAVRVQYVAGWPNSVVPASIQQWILLHIGTLYANRESTGERPANPSPFAARLLDRFRVQGL